MEKFGCIGPYYNNKEHICTNLTQSKKIKKMYTNGKKYYQKCLHPCKYLHLQLSQTLEGDMQESLNDEVSKTSFNFQPVVRKTKAYYSYGTLTLFAEVGGYLGLLLGYSVYNLADFIEYFCRKGIKSI